MHLIKQPRQLEDEGHTLFSVQFLTNQLVILSLLQFQILLVISPFFCLPLSSLLCKQFFVIYLNFHCFPKKILQLHEKVPFSIVVQEKFV
jgi:predicted membrane metal-binding protein